MYARTPRAGADATAAQANARRLNARATATAPAVAPARRRTVTAAVTADPRKAEAPAIATVRTRRASALVKKTAVAQKANVPAKAIATATAPAQRRSVNAAATADSRRAEAPAIATVRTRRASVPVKETAAAQKAYAPARVIATTIAPAQRRNATAAVRASATGTARQDDLAVRLATCPGSGRRKRRPGPLLMRNRTPRRCGSSDGLPCRVFPNEPHHRRRDQRGSITKPRISWPGSFIPAKYEPQTNVAPELVPGVEAAVLPLRHPRGMAPQ